jgi:hypothetical protein
LFEIAEAFLSTKSRKASNCAPKTNLNWLLKLFFATESEN